MPVTRGAAARRSSHAAKQVGRPIFFSLAIIIVSFIPVFLLEAQEGRMFRPLAFTKTFAMAAASLLVDHPRAGADDPVHPRPAAAGRSRGIPISRVFTAIYDPIIRLALRWKWTALLVNFAVIPLTIPLLFTLGSEFMPPLYEGSLLYMPTSPPGTVDHGSARVCSRCRTRCSASFPEVDTRLRHRRAGDHVDRQHADGDGQHDGHAEAARAHGAPGMTLEKLQAEMDDELQFPGFPNVWTQPIRNRLDMLLTGIKTPVGIKILGPDLNEIQRLGRGDRDASCSRVPGTRSVYAERVAQGYFADIRIDRDAIARHGLHVSATSRT